MLKTRAELRTTGRGGGGAGPLAPFQGVLPPHPQGMGKIGLRRGGHSSPLKEGEGSGKGALVTGQSKRLV